jgi:hypothetical protein
VPAVPWAAPSNPDSGEALAASAPEYAPRAEDNNCTNWPWNNEPCALSD